MAITWGDNTHRTREAPHCWLHVVGVAAPLPIGPEHQRAPEAGEVSFIPTLPMLNLYRINYFKESVMGLSPASYGFYLQLIIGDGCWVDGNELDKTASTVSKTKPLPALSLDRRTQAVHAATGVDQRICGFARAWVPSLTTISKHQSSDKERINRNTYIHLERRKYSGIS